MRLIDPRNRHTMSGHGVNGLSYGSLIGLTSLRLRPSGAGPVGAKLASLRRRGRLSLLHLFLSYANQDAARVRQISTDLRRPDIEPWMDDELKPAEPWNVGIEEEDKSLRFFRAVPLSGDATGRRESLLPHGVAVCL